MLYCVLGAFLISLTAYLLIGLRAWEWQSCSILLSGLFALVLAVLVSSCVYSNTSLVMLLMEQTANLLRGLKENNFILNIDNVASKMKSRYVTHRRRNEFITLTL